MGKTSIEWTDVTWNPTRGCNRVSPGCKNCYAERQAARFKDVGQPFHGFVKIHTNGEPRWTGKVELVEDKLSEPLRWRKPQRVFVNSMSDLFHEALPDDAIDRVFAVMALCPHHTFQILTKRPERMREYFRDKGVVGGDPSNNLYGRLLNRVNVVRSAFPKKYLGDIPVSNPARFPLRNVWLGVSVEDQKTADERIPLLLKTPAAIRFVSYEPALDRVDFTRFIFPDVVEEGHELHWVIVGGESGPGARPFDIEWARETVRQCRESGVACFVKQFGAKPIFTWDPNEPAAPKLGDRKGGSMCVWPEDLRVREFPMVRI